MMNKLFTMCLVILLTGSMALALDINIPTWRGDEGSTYQKWEFSTSNPTPLPDAVVNSYGMPALRVTPAVGHGWLDGAWPLSGQIDVIIPNRPVIDGYKDIRIQLLWKPLGVDPFLLEDPYIGVSPWNKIEMSRADIPQGLDWVHSTFDIRIWPNPALEGITIKGDIWVDELVIDTICVPEPATMALLSLGGLALMRKRRV